MKTILVIDDDRDLSETIKAVLEYAGYGVLISHDGNEGIQKAIENKPDLILIDVMMPGMDGAQAVRILKEKPVSRTIPIVFLTGLMTHSDKYLKEEGLNVGGIFYPTLAKPFENEKLLSMIEENLE